ncbi:MAG: hypothetical protein ACM3S1_13885 [Hyphomicrobiales bacterium]
MSTRQPGGADPNAVIDWARAIALGIRDTAKDMLEEGRRGAREAYQEYWDRFDEKVKRGRHRRDS